MTPADIALNLGHLMVGAGAIIAVWALVTKPWRQGQPPEPEATEEADGE